MIVYNVFQGLYYGIRTALYMDITNPAVAATQFTAYMALLNLCISYTAWWQGFAVERFGYPLTLVADCAFGMTALLLLPLMRPPQRASAATATATPGPRLPEPFPATIDHGLAGAPPVVGRPERDAERHDHRRAARRARRDARPRRSARRPAAARCRRSGTGSISCRWHRQSELGADGHPQRGGFLPPVPLPRRMWAGGRLTFHAAAARRRSDRRAARASPT